MLNLFLCFMSAVLVIGADALIKKASAGATWGGILTSREMLVCYGFYFVQILLAVIIFRSHGELAVYTNLFVVFYALLGIAFGIVVFNESLSPTQWVGAVLAIVGAYLINMRAE